MLYIRMTKPTLIVNNHRTFFSAVFFLFYSGGGDYEDEVGKCEGGTRVDVARFFVGETASLVILLRYIYIAGYEFCSAPAAFAAKIGIAAARTGMQGTPISDNAPLQNRS